MGTSTSAPRYSWPATSHPARSFVPARRSRRIASSAIGGRVLEPRLPPASAGVAWSAVDSDTARVTVAHRSLRQTLDIRVAATGQPMWVSMPRWSNANAEKTYRIQPIRRRPLGLPQGLGIPACVSRRRRQLLRQRRLLPVLQGAGSSMFACCREETIRRNDPDQGARDRQRQTDGSRPFKEQPCISESWFRSMAARRPSAGWTKPSPSHAWCGRSLPAPARPRRARLHDRIEAGATYLNTVLPQLRRHSEQILAAGQRAPPQPGRCRRPHRRVLRATHVRRHRRAGDRLGGRPHRPRHARAPRRQPPDARQRRGAGAEDGVAPVLLVRSAKEGVARRRSRRQRDCGRRQPGGGLSRRAARRRR